MLPLKKNQTTVFNRIFSAYSITTSNNFLTVIPEVKQKKDKCLHMQLLKLGLDDSRLLFCSLYSYQITFHIIVCCHQWCHILFYLLLTPFLESSSVAQKDCLVPSFWHSLHNLLYLLVYSLLFCLRTAAQDFELFQNALA